MLDLNQLAMFHAVVQAGSFAGAARRLGMPANSLSRHIRQLEEHLGQRLLRRSTRKLTLTSAGHTLDAQSREPLQEVLQAAQQLAQDSQTPHGTVRIAAPADFFDFFQMVWIAEFLATYPAVQLDFVLSDAHSDLIAEGIDIALRGGELEDSSLVARKLGDASQVLAASPGYLAQRGTPGTFTELALHDCILSRRLGRNPERTVWRLDGPQGPETVEVGGRFGANTAQSQLRAAIAGLGICLLPKNLLSLARQNGQLTQILAGWEKSSGGFYAVYPSRRQIPRAVSAFVDLVLQRMPV